MTVLMAFPHKHITIFRVVPFCGREVKKGQGVSCSPHLLGILLYDLTKFYISYISMCADFCRENFFSWAILRLVKTFELVTVTITATSLYKL